MPAGQIYLLVSQLPSTPRTLRECVFLARKARLGLVSPVTQTPGMHEEEAKTP